MRILTLRPPLSEPRRHSGGVMDPLELHRTLCGARRLLARPPLPAADKPRLGLARGVGATEDRRPPRLATTPVVGLPQNGGKASPNNLSGPKVRSPYKRVPFHEQLVVGPFAPSRVCRPSAWHFLTTNHNTVQYSASASVFYSNRTDYRYTSHRPESTDPSPPRPIKASTIHRCESHL